MISQVLAQPGVLRRTGSAATQASSFAIRVQHHYMPSAQLIAVITFAARSGLPRPILVISSCTALPVFMVPQRRPCARLEFAPRPAIAILKLPQGNSVVSQISQRKHGPRDFLDELRRLQSALQILTASDIARPHQNRRLVTNLGCGASGGLRRCRRSAAAPENP